MSRFAIFGAKDPHAITPRLDPVRRTRRIDPNAPVVAAYLEGRPVMLVRPDPLTRRPGKPADLTIPMTVSRFQHAMDIERGYDARMWEPTPLIGFGSPGLAEVINCAPWRLPQPRWLTPYEWTVVEGAVHGAILSARNALPDAQTQAMARTLTGAIATQATCPAWKQSSFGPAPTVAVYNYGCLASWWATLDPASQAFSLADIGSGKLLCQPNPPWAQCPLSALSATWTPSVQSEYAIQRGAYGQPGVVADSCAWTRSRTAYFPTTGQGLIDLMRTVGGGVLSPQLQQMAQLGGTVFANRSFVVGLEFRPQPDWSKMPGTLGTMQDLQKLADAMLAEAALIWAPGQGISIRQMLVTGQVDPAQLTALMQGMMPGAIDDILKSIPGFLQWLPGLMQGVPPSNVMHRLDGSSSPNAPGTAPSTGLAVVDNPGTMQDTAPPDWLRSNARPPSVAAAKPSMDPEMWLAGAVILLGGAMLIRGYQTRKRR